jgi:hypothetical protein
VEPDVSLQLRQIARALNVPVEAFFQERHSDTVLAGAVELLRCWQEIEGADNREQLLSLARKLASKPPLGRMAAE